MKKVKRLLFILHWFVGIGAIGGGLMAILNPEGPGGMPTNALENSPFQDFLIPGIILFAIIGLGNVLCAFIFHFNLKYQGYISFVFSVALVIWIIVQCIMLRSVVLLHVIYLIIGLVEICLSVFLGYAQHLFPSKIIHNGIKAIKGKVPKSIIINNISKVEEKIYEAKDLRDRS